MTNESADLPAEPRNTLRSRWRRSKKRRTLMLLLVIIVALVLIFVPTAILIYMIVNPHKDLGPDGCVKDGGIAMCTNCAREYCAVDPCSYLPQGTLTIEAHGTPADINVVPAEKLACTSSNQFVKGYLARAFQQVDFSSVVIIGARSREEHDLALAWVIYCAAGWAGEIAPIQKPGFCASICTYHALLRRLRRFEKKKQHEVASFGATLLLATECSPVACIKRFKGNGGPLVPSLLSRRISLQFLHRITDLHH